MKFHKSLAKYYIHWYQDACDSIVYCAEKGLTETINQYKSASEILLTIIMENWEAIEFFSVSDRAFLIDSALPVEFRGYE